MDDLIGLLIVVAVVVIKAVGAIKKHTPSSDSDTDAGNAWKVLLEGLTGKDVSAEDIEVFNGENAGKYAGTEVSMQVENAADHAYVQSQSDADMLAAQQRYAAMGAAAAEENISRSGQCSCMEEVAEEESVSIYRADEWAELIRNNRLEAVAMSEILSKPAALR
ncbi:MAG: hypothetical protein E7056_03385 [Lentisphaerae bacterium]|nr:hypothetical protein [Lentisphaerota bacterium]